MRTLVLLRHAKAVAGAGAADVERALAPEGIEAAARVGRFLAAAGFAPDLVVTSPARRARETADGVGRAAGWTTIARLERPFYESTPRRALAELRRLPDQAATVVAVGHEPTWSTLASDLVGGGALYFPTGCGAAIRLAIDDWSSLGEHPGVLLWLLPPKLLFTAAT